MMSCDAVSSSLHSGSIARPYVCTTACSHSSHASVNHAHTLSSGSPCEAAKPKNRTHENGDKHHFGFSSAECIGNSFPSVHSARYGEKSHEVHGTGAVVVPSSDGKNCLSGAKCEGDEEDGVVEQDDDEAKKRRTSLNSELTPGISSTPTGTNVTGEEAGRPRDSPPNEIPQFRSEEEVAVCNADAVLNFVPHVKESDCANTFDEAVMHQSCAPSGNDGKDASIITASKSATEASPFEESSGNINNNNASNSSNNSDNNRNNNNNKKNDRCSDGNGSLSKESDNNKKREIDLNTARTGITLFLERLCEDNKEVPVLTSDFHSHRLPPMSVKDYVDRIVRYSRVSGETTIVSIMLLLKYSFFVAHPVSVYNVHRLLITSILLGVKMRDDIYYSNEYYSRIGGISNVELNKLELGFGTVMEWDLWITEEEYMEFVGLLRDLISTVGTQTNAVSANLSTHTTIRRAAENNNNNNNDNSNTNDDEESVAQTAETIEHLRNKCWTERFLPWLRKFDESAQKRRDRRKRLVQEDLYLEQRNTQLWQQQQQQQQQQHHPFDASGKRGYVPAEQVILPAVYSRRGHSSGHGGHGGGPATVVNVPSLAPGAVRSAPSPRGPSGAPAGPVTPPTAGAPPGTASASASASGISIDAKPYFYKSASGGSGSHHHHQQQHLYQQQQQQQYRGRRTHAGDEGYSRGNYAAMRFPPWRQLQGSGGRASGNLGAEREEGAMRRGGKKRAKPDHYQDYR